MNDKYRQLFDEHLERAKQIFIKNNGRDPSLYELLDEYHKMMHYFYQDSASFLIFAALVSPYLLFNFL